MHKKFIILVYDLTSMLVTIDSNYAYRILPDHIFRVAVNYEQHVHYELQYNYSIFPGYKTNFRSTCHYNH